MITDRELIKLAVERINKKLDGKDVKVSFEPSSVSGLYNVGTNGYWTLVAQDVDSICSYLDGFEDAVNALSKTR